MHLPQEYQHFLEVSSDPRLSKIRLQRLLEESIVCRFMREQPERWVGVFINIIATSNFLFHYLCRHPESVYLIGSHTSQLNEIEGVVDIEGLRLLKYRELLRITALDIDNHGDYQEILSALSILADSIVIKALSLIEQDESIKWHDKNVPFSLFAMGKLGAQELNYSSDIDLLFICDNTENIDGDMYEYHAAVVQRIQRLIHYFGEKTANGYLYRIDLNLRPWGKDAPLVMQLDDTEHYYEASTEAWERLAWLRARFVAGDASLANELLNRLYAYRYRKNFSVADLERFLFIKTQMQAIRIKHDSWDVKTGTGGIRDIEFFLQMLQIFNAVLHPVLQQTNTMQLLSSMVEIGLIDSAEAEEIRVSYLFLRRLENHLQMVDELQVQSLPHDLNKRLMIAKSMGFSAYDEDSILQKFEQCLQQQQNIARNCFDKILLTKEHIQ